MQIPYLQWEQISKLVKLLHLLHLLHSQRMDGLVPVARKTTPENSVVSVVPKNQMTLDGPAPVVQ
jgi:hypothetical protein